MILIADAGATKTDWRLIERGKVHQFSSNGFNPRTHSVSLFVNSIPGEVIMKKSLVENVYYYGAGLSDPLFTNRLRGLLQAEFNRASVSIETDLTGAARALFGMEAGVACILGTGSAACFYDGNGITRRIPSLGYVLGDEGSGAFLGRELLNQYLRGLLPDRIHQKLKSEYNWLNEELVLHHVYQEPQPNGYMARFASFVINNQDDPFLYQMAYKNVELFFQKYFSSLEELRSERIRFTGSVAYYLSNILRKFASDHQLNIDLISQHPISGLTLYHKQHG